MTSDFPILRPGMKALGLQARGIDFSGLDLSDSDLGPLVSYDDNEQDYSRWVRSMSVKGSDLMDTNLQAVDFTNTNLRRARMIGADLRRANLSNTALTETDLSCANLAGIDLTRANIAAADSALIKESRHSTFTSFMAANLKKADLSGRDLRGVCFAGANFDGANLRASNLSGPMLDGMRRFWSVTPQGVESLMRFCGKNDAEAVRSRFPALEVEARDVISSNLMRLESSLAKWFGSHDCYFLIGASFKHADLRGANLDFSNLTGVDLTGALLDGSSIRFANLSQLNIEHIDLTGVDLHGALMPDGSIVS